MQVPRGNASGEWLGKFRQDGWHRTLPIYFCDLVINMVRVGLTWPAHKRMLTFLGILLLFSRW